MKKVIKLLFSVDPFAPDTQLTAGKESRRRNFLLLAAAAAAAAAANNFLIPAPPWTFYIINFLSFAFCLAILSAMPQLLLEFDV